MFGFFKANPSKKLQKRYEEKLGDALEAQRNGRIPEYARLTAESEAIARRIEQLEARS